jgi:methylglutaconyl-CoA hydratase
MKFSTIKLEIIPKIAQITLARPSKRNAFNEIMIKELRTSLKQLSSDEKIRLLVLTGQGQVFCAGADLDWMRKKGNLTYEENFKDAMELGLLLYDLYSFPKPTLAKVNGHAIGGGVGLVAACDIAIATEEANFSLSEVKIGLVPACISPYLLKKMGERPLRELFLTGERIPAQKALQLGLLNYVVKKEELNSKIEQIIKMLLTSGPHALSMAKELLTKLAYLDLKQATKFTAQMIAQLREGKEAKEGIQAFFEKRKPNWAQ